MTEGRRGTLGTIALTTMIAGSLDLASAFGFAGLAGMSPARVLAYVASGPFGEAALSGGGWLVVGGLVHYAIMTIMVVAYLMATRRFPALHARSILVGLAYGIILWIIMYWIVKPIRWPSAPLPHTLSGVASAVFSHCLMVGVPMALMIRARDSKRAISGRHQMQ